MNMLAICIPSIRAKITIKIKNIKFWLIPPENMAINPKVVKYFP